MFVMMIALAITVLLGVVYRWSGNALVWYDEVASVQLAWLTYYGSAYAALKGAHIGVPSILKSFPIPLRKVFFIISKIVIYSFFTLMTYYGLLVMKLIKGETLTILEWVPQSLVQSVIPVGSVLFILSDTLRLKEDYQITMGMKQGEHQS